MADRGEKWNLWQILFSWPPKSLWMVTAAMKWKTLAPWRKAMTNLESILKSRDITLLTKVLIVKAMFFPVVMYGCESWTIKKAEHWRVDGFELCCCTRHLRVPWSAKRSNQSILKGISLEYSLEGLMLKLQYFGHVMQRAYSVEKTLMLGKIEGRRRRGWQRMRWLDGIITQWTWVSANSRRWWRTGKPGMLQFMEFQRVEHNLVNEQGQPYLWEQHWYSWFQLCFAKLFKMVGKLAGAMS